MWRSSRPVSLRFPSMIAVSSGRIGKPSAQAVPALLYRLDRLEAGLALEPNNVVSADPTVRELVLETSRIFVMRPADAARARAAFLRRVTAPSEAGMARWAKAAATLKLSFPKYADLAPGLIQRLIRSRTTAKKLARRRKQLAGGRVGTLVTKAKEKPTWAAAPAPRPNVIKRNPPYWLVYLLVVVAVSVIKIAIGTSSRPSSSVYPPYVQPKINIDEVLERLQKGKAEPDASLPHQRQVGSPASDVKPKEPKSSGNSPP